MTVLRDALNGLLLAIFINFLSTLYFDKYYDEFCCCNINGTINTGEDISNNTPFCKFGEFTSYNHIVKNVLAKPHFFTAFNTYCKKYYFNEKNHLSYEFLSNNCSSILATKSGF